ncbi:MAG: Glyoxylate reductase [Candidatus Curtissbacteria bacterium GW2011_GWA1_40_9]|uniref:Glyoxylate reductase n=1 Tax=Candidatus Curtissbacteria bacterium GW2011_GWA1_40_9 TaxID=1618408 RepID=A0A0G0TTF6_9BACT|nr:MAG: Glyoxylate reductase [Candidatus Curtissbacteria bacterium GW2011_GWA1_40_9]
MPSVYITNPIPAIGINLLYRKGFKVDINKSGRDLSISGLKKIVGDYDAVLSFLTNKIDADMIDYASKNLRVIANFAVGFDNIDVKAANSRGIIVCNTPGVASESVAEHTFAMILALKKMLIAQDKFVRDGKYNKWDPNLFLSYQVWGQTIGIIGLGRIGTFVAQIAHGGFRMNILYFDVKRSEDLEILAEAVYARIHEILKRADIVTLHLPLDHQTRHLIGREEFRLMKNSALLINTARGPIVDEEALIWALDSGEIAGAGLDVFEYEPKIGRELLQTNKVILSPHTASATFETREEMSRIAAQNIIDVFERKEPFGLVRV